MGYWKRLTIVQRYQVFFCLTAILPVLAYTLLFFKGAYAKLNQQIANQVQSGIVLIEDALNDDYAQLKLSSSQATLLAIDKAYDTYLYTHDKKSLKHLLQRYQHSVPFSIVMLIDAHGQVVDSLGNITPVNPAFLRLRIAESLQGKKTFGIQRFQKENHNLQLANFVLSPVMSPSKGQVEGAFLVGSFLQNNHQFDVLSKLSPDYLLRIFVKTTHGNQLEFANHELHPNLLTSQLDQQLTALEQYPTRAARARKARASFAERIGRQAYITAVFALKNDDKNTIGYITFSIPKRDEEALLIDNLILTLTTGVGALIFVVLMGTWFKFDFIDPMNALSLAFQRVARGDFKNRISFSHKTNEEVLETFHGFNAMLEKLEENEALKKNFVTMLTHDLRTPLLAQERVATILREEDASMNVTERKRLVEGLLQNNASLLEMINTLLEIYEYEEGNITLNKNTVDLKQLIESCFNALKPVAQTKKISLSATFSDSTIEIQGDYSYLKRVFMNLIANAIQNIPKESHIRIHVGELTEKNMVEIVISDNGQGISPDILPHLFERYYAGHGVQKKIGTGLGLYICKMIVELHRGSIWVQSQLDEGTSFSIRLPKETFSYV